MSAASNQRQQNGTKEANYALQNAQAAAASELLQVAVCKFRSLKYKPFEIAFYYFDNIPIYNRINLILAIFLI